METVQRWLWPLASGRASSSRWDLSYSLNLVLLGERSFKYNLMFSGLLLPSSRLWSTKWTSMPYPKADRANGCSTLPVIIFFSQPVPLRGGLRQRVGIIYMCRYVGISAVISSSSSSSVSVEEGSSWTCVGVSP